VPGQPPRALARLRVPDLDSLVVASTGYLLAVWVKCDGPDPAVSDEMSQYTKQLRQGKKIGREKKSYKLECPVSVHLQEPVSTSHRRTVSSLLPEAITVPSTEKAAELTPALHNRSNN
jgi:hypothetical protein